MVEEKKHKKDANVEKKNKNNRPKQMQQSASEQIYKHIWRQWKRCCKYPKSMQVFFWKLYIKYKNKLYIIYNAN